MKNPFLGKKKYPRNKDSSTWKKCYILNNRKTDSRKTDRMAESCSQDEGQFATKNGIGKWEISHE